MLNRRITVIALGLAFVGAIFALTNIHTKTNMMAEPFMNEKLSSQEERNRPTQLQAVQKDSSNQLNNKHKEKNDNAPTLAATQNTNDHLTGIERIANSPVIMESISEKDSSGNYQITKIVDSEFKYPHIRIVEQYREDASGLAHLLNTSFMVADHLSVKLQNGVELNDLEKWATAEGYSIRKSYQNADYALVSFDLDHADSVEDVQTLLTTRPDLIAYAEMDYLRVPTAVIPNDTQFFRQSHLDYQRTPDAGGPIDNTGAWQAWERRTDALKSNGDYVTIGIIDTGVAIVHGDLENNIWTNPNEISGNGIDDDGNGFIDDMHGWNFDTDSADYSDLGGHGTHVAGIVAAEGNNGLGISGMTWAANIVSADIFTTDVTAGSTSAEAIRYMIDIGVDLLNASYGENNYMQVECDAIQEAHEAGILFISAAGNNNQNLDLDGNDHFPAECDVENVIVVGGGSTRIHEIDFALSNYGAEAVDIIAPYWALSTYYWDAEYPEDSFSLLEGTSMSAPMVTGAAALLIAEHPDLSHLEIKQLLMDSATRATPISATSQSGVLNVSRAMNYDIATRAAEVINITATSDDGNLPSNAMDNDTTTRWSSNGVGESITFELSKNEVLSSIDIQWLNGDRRAAKFSVESSLDGSTWEQIFGGYYAGENLEQSSGASTELEHYRLLNVESRYVRISANGNTASDWNSIVETVIHVFDENTNQALNTPANLVAEGQDDTIVLTWDDTSFDETAYQILRRTNGSTWSTIIPISDNSEQFIDSDVTTGNTYEYRVQAINDTYYGPLSNSVTLTFSTNDFDNMPEGPLTIVDVLASSDDGNIAENTLDKNLDTRWSSLGDGQWIDYTLEAVKTITQVHIAWLKGDERSSTFTLSARTDDGEWVEIYSGISGGSDIELETFEIPPTQADSLRYTGYGNTLNNWNSITEFEIEGY